MFLSLFSLVLFSTMGTLSEARGIPTNMGMDHVGFTVRNVTESMEFLMTVFDCVFDWEVKRDPRPNAGERGWAKLFDVHEESYLKHVVMLKCGDYHLTQYLELFEWVSPDQALPALDRPWQRFADLGHSYISFTVKDVFAVVEHIKSLKWPGVRIIQDPPMNFPLRGETCTSTFVVSPWGQWIELSQWSISGPQGQVIKELREATNPEQCIIDRSTEEGRRAGYRCQEKQGGVEKYKRFSEIGMKIEDLETPAFLVDLDAMDHNIGLMTLRMKEKNVSWRPPVKAHKSPALARRLIEAGAEGILVLKLSEAEIFAEEGFDDIHLSNIVVDPKKVRRVAQLARRIKRMRVQVDTVENIQQYAAAAKDLGVQLEVLVEINIGHNRTGVLPVHAPRLAKAVVDAEKDGLKFVGLAGYEGHTPIMPPEQKKRETHISHAKLAEARRLVEAEGIAVEVMTAGGSCNYMQSLDEGVINEMEAGGGAIVDNLYMHKANLADHGHQIGAFILTQIVSVPEEGDRAMGDAGFKSCGIHPFGGNPVVYGRDDLEVVGMSAEHLKLKPKGTDKINLKVGEKILVVPGYTDVMGMLHRRIYAVRHGVVEDVWPILAAGALA